MALQLHSPIHRVQFLSHVFKHSRVLPKDTLNENMIMHRSRDCCWLFPTEKTTAAAASQCGPLMQVDNVNVNSLTRTLNVCSLKPDEYLQIFQKTLPEEAEKTVWNKREYLVGTHT